MTERKVKETNTDRMVQKNRAPVEQPERAGTGPESQTYQQRTEMPVPADEASKQADEAGKVGVHKNKQTHSGRSCE